MQRRPPSFSGALRRQVINDRIRPGISYHVKVFVFVYDGNKVFLYIPAVAEDDDIFLFMEYRHYMPYHGCSQFQLGFFFSATSGIQAERKDSGSCLCSIPGHRPLHLRSSVRSDSLNHYALHGQKALKHPRIFCQISKPLCHQCTETQAVTVVFPV